MTHSFSQLLRQVSQPHDQESGRFRKVLVRHSQLFPRLDVPQGVDRGILASVDPFVSDHADFLSNVQELGGYCFIDSQDVLVLLFVAIIFVAIILVVVAIILVFLVFHKTPGDVIVIVVVIVVIILGIPVVPAVDQRGVIGIHTNNEIILLRRLAGGVQPQKDVAKEGRLVLHQVGEKVPEALGVVKLHGVGRLRHHRAGSNVFFGKDPPANVGNRLDFHRHQKVVRVVAFHRGGPVLGVGILLDRLDVGLHQQRVVVVGGDRRVGIGVVDGVVVRAVAVQLVGDRPEVDERAPALVVVLEGLPVGQKVFGAGRRAIGTAVIIIIIIVVVVVVIDIVIAIVIDARGQGLVGGSCSEGWKFWRRFVRRISSTSCCGACCVPTKRSVQDWKYCDFADGGGCFHGVGLGC
mmetsp:Transcript_1026/g.2645  ORF Transcript_1026/g.2645 Transcript_1026/m.2645 type:complete len:407 (+) Transcript_1026:108-1328(+)